MEVAERPAGTVLKCDFEGKIEQFIYDDNGQQLSVDFENYKLANAADVPDVEVTYAPTPCPHTPLGTRGIGVLYPDEESSPVPPGVKPVENGRAGSADMQIA